MSLLLNTEEVFKFDLVYNDEKAICKEILTLMGQKKIYISIPSMISFIHKVYISPAFMVMLLELLFLKVARNWV